MATTPTTGEATLTPSRDRPRSDEHASQTDEHASQTTDEAFEESSPAGGETVTGGRRRGRRLRAARAGLRSLWDARPRRRISLVAVLRALGLARQAVPEPVVGLKAYPRWWQRIAALLALAGLVVAIGFATAALVGFLVVVAGFLLEQAIA